MVEVFITDIKNTVQGDRVLESIIIENPELKINYDLNETDLEYPCGHTILRVQT